MSTYHPNKWSLIKVETDTGPVYKVFGCWSGGYLSGDSWQMNSGIVSITKVGESYEFKGYSGSVYVCHEEMYGFNVFGHGVLQSFLKKYPDKLSLVEEDGWQTELKDLFT